MNYIYIKKIFEIHTHMNLCVRVYIYVYTFLYMLRLLYASIHGILYLATII